MMKKILLFFLLSLFLGRRTKSQLAQSLSQAHGTL